MKTQLYSSYTHSHTLGDDAMERKPTNLEYFISSRQKNKIENISIMSPILAGFQPARNQSA